MKTKIRIVKYFKGRGFVESEDTILNEYTFSIKVEGVTIVELLAIPKDLRELVLGYLYTERIINSIDDIKQININKEEAYADVILDKKIVRKNGECEYRRFTTDSGDFRLVPYQFYGQDKLQRVKKINFDPEYIIDNFQKLTNGSDLFKDTGNVHSVQICENSEVKYFSEDIGRYNAFDKCIGKALIDGYDLSKAAVYTSGRIPSSIVMKAVRTGIPIIVSRSAPSTKSLAIAKRYNVTLIGFATREKINIYNVQEDV